MFIFFLIYIENVIEASGFLQEFQTTKSSYIFSKHKKYDCHGSLDSFKTVLLYRPSWSLRTISLPKSKYLILLPQIFIFIVLFQKTNENSLKQLSSVIETLQSKRTIKPCNLPFYLRDKTYQEGKNVSANRQL